MRALVTGASGMLGAQLCRQLHAEGLIVRALARGPLRHPLLADIPLETAPGDLCEPQSLREAARDCRVVFHAAGKISYLPRERRECFAVNVEGTRNLLQAATSAGVERVIVTSSTAAVGIPKTGEPPLDETAPFSPRYQSNPYMASKREAEQLALAWPDMATVAVNPSTIYGGGDVKGNTAVVFRRLARGRLRWIPPGGLGVVSVADCARGHLLAWRSGQAGQRYILCGANLTFAELLPAIASALEVQPPMRRLPPWLERPATLGLAAYDLFCGGAKGASLSRHMAPLLFRRRFYSSARAERELGWAPQQSLEEMIGEAADFYREHDML